jgi:hypothetical protein
VSKGDIARESEADATIREEFPSDLPPARALQNADLEIP